MGAIAFVGLALVALVVLGFVIYGVFLGLAVLARGLAVLWLRVMVSESGAATLAGGPTGGAVHPRGERSETHCWEMKRCPEEARRSCPAHARPDLPCWLACMQASDELRLKSSCMACQLFNIPALMTGV